MQDLLGGQIPFISDTITAAIPQVKSGKVRAIAVTSGRRSPLLPEVPTLDEQGVRGYEAIGWIGILAPAGSPATALDRLAAESQKVTAVPDMQKRMADLGLVPMDQTREKFRDFIRSELQKWAKVIAAAGVKGE
jgi:tripartite-type tricarboxylate transporter receptor subunit TctC